MDALERIKRISPPVRPSVWTEEDFRRAKAEGHRRWRETQELFKVEHGLFGDPISKFDPAFELSSEELEAIESIQVPRGGGNCPSYVLRSFLRWARHPRTMELPNPMEPWVQIWEHSGAISVEHAEFVDVSFAVRADDGSVRYGRV
jgi:hypothetical protein